MSPSDDPRSMRERMLAGDLYIADDPVLVAESRRAMELTEAYNCSSAAEPDERRRLLTELLGAYGEGSEIRPPFFCDYGYQITVGAQTFANFGLVILDVTRVSIGDDVQIGPNVQLLTGTHPLAAGPAATSGSPQLPSPSKTTSGSGGGAIVCPGVTIGENTVVAAGSVVTKDLPATVLPHDLKVA